MLWIGLVLANLGMTHFFVLGGFTTIGVLLVIAVVGICALLMTCVFVLDALWLNMCEKDQQAYTEGTCTYIVSPLPYRVW